MKARVLIVGYEQTISEPLAANLGRMASDVDG